MYNNINNSNSNKNNNNNNNSKYRKVKKNTYPNAKFGCVFSFHLPRSNAQEQLQV